MAGSPAPPPMEPAPPGRGPGGAHAPGEAGPLRFADPAQESLNQALRSAFNVMRFIMVVMLVAYFASGWFQVGPGEQGVIVRFGALRENPAREGPFAKTPIFGPGWHFALPDPFDQKILIRAQSSTLVIDTFLFDRGPDRGKPLGARPLSELVVSKPSLNPGVDGAMLSGDRNLSHGLWTVEYRIADAARFVRNVAESPAALEPLLRRLTEAAIVDTVAGRRVEEILKYDLGSGVAADAVAEEVKARLRAALERLDAGVVVDRVTSETIEPGGVRHAFKALTDAENERKRVIEEAEANRNQILNRTAGATYPALIEAIEAYGAAQAVDSDEARLESLRAAIDRRLGQAKGEVASLLARAQSQATAARELVQGEYDEFLVYLDAYRKDPRSVTERRWLRTREAVLSSKQNEVLWLPRSNVIEILTNRDPQRLQAAELERIRRDTGRP